MHTRRRVLCLLTALAALAPAAHADDRVSIRVALIGDSTVASYDVNKLPTRGWGQLIVERFKPGVSVLNHAASGRSSKSFLREGRWEKVLALQPHYVFIQFGHNDQPGKGDRTTDPAGDYRDNLRRYIGDARKIGATPVLVTSVARRTFSAADPGRIDTTLTPYVEAMKQVGDEKSVAVIDLHALSIALYEKLGPAECQTFENKPGDRTHFNEKGARALAALVAAELPARVPQFKAYLK